MKFTLRELFLGVLIVALSLGWWLHSCDATRSVQQLKWTHEEKRRETARTNAETIASLKWEIEVYRILEELRAKGSAAGPTIKESSEAAIEKTASAHE